jgi:transcriptional regulator with XRE-family HTH domain
VFNIYRVLCFHGKGVTVLAQTMSSHILILFGKSLRKLRMKRRLSQEKLAELCGLHTNYIGRIERGQQNISLINIEKLARGLRVKPMELFRRIPRPTHRGL